MNRLNKIQLLTDISIGKKAVSDLHPETVEMWLIDESGMYVEPFKGLQLDKTEFEAHKAKAGKRTMFVPDERFNCKKR